MPAYRRDVLARAVTHALVGLEPRRVEVEAHVEQRPARLRDRRPRRPRLPGGEAPRPERRRVGGARMAGDQRITVNLAPAALRKEGSGFDLPIALAMLAASRQSRRTARRRTPRSASSRSTAGCGRSAGRSPSPRARGAPGSSGSLCAAESARRGRARGYRAGAGAPPRRGCRVPPRRDRGPPLPSRRATTALAAGAPDLADVRGQERARRALEIAAAGRAQPPARRAARARARRCSRAGCRASCLRSTADEALEVTRIHSVAGSSRPERPLLAQPPFRAPHHSASAAAIVGGGPGRVPARRASPTAAFCCSTSCPSSTRPVLEALRQPLEDGVVSIARVGGQRGVPGALPAARDDEPLSVRRPRRPRGRVLVLAAAARPRSATSSRVRCSTASTSSSPCRGRGRRSSPRRPASRRGGCASGSSPRASGCARRRSRTAAADELLDRAVERLPLSGRGRARVARVARTIAALAGADAVLPEHVAEALAYRSPRSFGPRERARALRVCRRDAGRMRRASPDSGASPLPRGFDERRERARLAALGVRCLGRSDAAFPALLRAIHDPPPGLFVRGAPTSTSSPRRRSRSSARARARRYGRPRRAHARPGAGGGRASSSSAASPVVSTARRTAARSKRAG